jgi:hypothetical protein
MTSQLTIVPATRGWQNAAAGLKDAARRLRRSPAAILDPAVLLCPGLRKGRDEQTALPPNKQTPTGGQRPLPPRPTENRPTTQAVN